VPFWCAQGEFYLSHYSEITANVVTLHNVCPFFCLATIMNVQENSTLLGLD